MRPIKVLFVIAFLLALTVTPSLLISESSHAAPGPSPLPESVATTEFNCSFGMAQGETQHTCQVPIPTGCVVANFPGSVRPWTSISKGGNTLCKFDDKATDWKTRITGTCGKCKTGHCSVQFIVKFDCSQRK